MKVPKTALLVATLSILLVFSLGFQIYQSINAPNPPTPITPITPQGGNLTIVYGVVQGDIDLVGFSTYPIQNLTYFFFVDNGFYNGTVVSGYYEFVYYCRTGGSFTRNQLVPAFGNSLRQDVSGCL